MKNTIKVTSITIITSKHDSDAVYLHTDLTPNTPLMYPDGTPTLNIRVQAGYGGEWCEKNFEGVPVSFVRA